MEEEVDIVDKEGGTPKGEPFAVVTSTGDVVKSDVYNRYTVDKEEDGDTSPTKQLTEDYFSDIYGEKGLAKPLYNPGKLAGLLEVNTYHNRCTRTKAQDIAGNGYRLVKNQENANVEEKERLEEFFDSQFPPLEETLVKAEIDYQSIGYCFFELVKEGNMHNTVYKYINHAPAHTIRASRKKVGKLPRKFAQQRAGETVWFKSPLLEKDVDKDTGEEYELGELSDEQRANDMIMMKEYTPRSSYYGVPNIVQALGAIWGNLAQQEYNNEFFKNHGIPRYAVYITGDYNLEVDEEGKPVVVKKIKEFMNEVRKNPHSSLVFGIPSNTAGMGENVQVHFEPLSVETKDASFRMFRKDNRNEVIIAHAVPGNRIGVDDVGSLGGDTAYETNRIYKESIIGSRQFEIEEYVNRYIIRENFDIQDWKFKLKTISVDSTEKDKDVLGFLFENGAATPNDLIRNLGEEYGIEPSEKEGMDDHYINGQPMDKVHAPEAAMMSKQAEDATLEDIDEISTFLKNKNLARKSEKEGDE